MQIELGITTGSPAAEHPRPSMSKRAGVRRCEDDNEASQNHSESLRGSHSRVEGCLRSGRRRTLRDRTQTCGGRGSVGLLHFGEERQKKRNFSTLIGLTIGNGHLAERHAVEKGAAIVDDVAEDHALTDVEGDAEGPLLPLDGLSIGTNSEADAFGLPGVGTGGVSASFASMTQNETHEMWSGLRSVRTPPGMRSGAYSDAALGVYRVS